MEIAPLLTRLGEIRTFGAYFLNQMGGLVLAHDWLVCQLPVHWRPNARGTVARWSGKGCGVVAVFKDLQSADVFCIDSSGSIRETKERGSMVAKLKLTECLEYLLLPPRSATPAAQASFWHFLWDHYFEKRASLMTRCEYISVFLNCNYAFLGSAQPASIYRNVCVLVS